MPWCPKCKMEYIEGIETCSDCHAGLVDEIPPDDSLEKYKGGEPELLVTVADEAEANRIEALLNTNNIPVIRQYGGPGGTVKVITGNTAFGIELHIPSKLIKDALIILQRDDVSESAILLEDESKPLDDPDILEEETYEYDDDELDAFTADVKNGSAGYNPEIKEKASGKLKSVIIGLLAVAAVIVMIYIKGRY